MSLTFLYHKKLVQGRLTKVMTDRAPVVAKLILPLPLLEIASSQ